MAHMISLILLYCCVLLIAAETRNETEAADVSEAAEVAEAAGDLEAKDTNLTVTVVLASLEEELPAPAPLVGTFPHDFAMPLPSVSRRSYEPGPGTHSFEEQGQCGIETFFRQIMVVFAPLQQTKSFSCQSCPRVRTTAAGRAWRAPRRTERRRPRRRSTGRPLEPR